MRKPLARHCRSFERLEARHMLAGNVTVSVFGGDAFIIGDLADNNIFIQGTVVTGRASAGSPTSINGTPNGSFDFAAFTQHLNVVMAAGTDVVEVNGLTVPGNLSINTGDGADLLRFNPVRVDVVGTILLVTDAGGDRVLLTGGTMAGGGPGHRAQSDLVINTGAGNDEVRVTEFAVGLNTTIELGSEADFCDVRFSAIATDFFINGGAAYDSISVDTCSSNAAAFNGNADLTTLVVKNSRFTGNLGLFTAGGDDFVLLQSSRIDGVAALVMDASGGTGNDNFLVRGSVIHELQAVMEGGDDWVNIQTSALDRLFAYFGEGSDWLLFSNSIVDETTQADGGGGLDLFTRGGSLLSGLSMNGFEVIQ
jgi:hypothetical protein